MSGRDRHRFISAKTKKQEEGEELINLCLRPQTRDTLGNRKKRGFCDREIDLSAQE
jgi:hypothetical protein